MTYIFSILRTFWSILISYLRPDQPKIKLGDDRANESVNECEPVRKQLQKANTFFAILLFQVFDKYKQVDKQLNDIITEKESLKQAVREIQEQTETLERELNDTREVLTKLRLENTLLEQKVEQLESHKKVLIQELGGSLTGQDIEFITWEFLIQKVKEVTNQLNEVISHNQSLIKTNRDLQKERDVLRKEVNQVKDYNTRLTQDNSQIRASQNFLESELRRTLDRMKPLEIAKDKLEQEKAQLERKIYELNKVEYKLRQVEVEVEQLEKKIEELKQSKSQLDAELKQEKAKIVQFEQKNRSLEQERNQLETALKQETNRIAVLEGETNNLRRGGNESKETTYEGGNESKETTDDKDELLRKISQLNQTIKQLEAKITQLECKPDPSSSGQEQERSKRYDNYLDVLDEIDLLELYNDLVYLVQKFFDCSGIEELDEWEKTEDFYVEVISKLCFIDRILISKIEFLEDHLYLISNIKDNQTLHISSSYNYPGKFLFWSNGQVQWELSSFFNSRI